MAIESSNHAPAPAAGRNGNSLSLAEAIAVSTRAIHAKLNKSIVARLPLALPPNAPDSSMYACGLLHIAPIYTTFEALWRNIIDSPISSDRETPSAPDAQCTPNMACANFGAHPSSNEHQGPSERVQLMLKQLYLPGLLRSDRLKADVAALTGWPLHVVEEQLRATSQAGPLSDFVVHIKESVGEKPHILVAYSYIMFMALFAGGRFIRATLESAAPDFWLRPDTAGNPDADEDAATYTGNEPAKTQELPFRFLHFNTPIDGEDLKRQFKNRLLESDHVITQQEKDDIVNEAIVIFEQISAIVSQLDEICGQMPHQSPESEQSSPTLSDLIQSTLPARLRDSVAVTRERRVRNRSSKKSSSGEESAGTVIRHRVKDTSVSSFGSHRSDVGAHDHPTIPAGTGIELCPAMAARAVRFDGSISQKPQRRFSTAWKSETWRNLGSGIGYYHLLATVTVAVFLAALLAIRSRFSPAPETRVIP